ncbi:hypothetical protein ACFXKW_28225 [Streptomyces sp. NPDC059193]|uniref:hypothetical protein n=1 Tax=Streptomyces sp. NPDC059193 TaxID=3346763 RepID=UPI00368AB9F3
MSAIAAPSALDLARTACPAGTEIQAPSVQGSAVIGTPAWPFISSRSTERSLPGILVIRPGLDQGLGYADEVDRDEGEQDRDRDGGLWARVSTDLSGTGTVENAIPHPYRQRALMDRLLCQVCAGSPKHDARGGFLFVVPDGPRDRSAAGADWAERALEATPPVCLADAEQSATGCPRLGRVTALWVRRPVLYGVTGIGYRLRSGALHPFKTTVPVSYEDPALAWTVAHQMVRRLEEVTVDWDLTEFLRSRHRDAWSASRRAFLRSAPAAELAAVRGSCPRRFGRGLPADFKEGVCS